MIMGITGNDRVLFDECVSFARAFIFLPEKIDFYFDSCPSIRFPNETVAMTNESNMIFVNQQWYQKHIVISEDNVRYFVFHELRHSFQAFAIEHFKSTGSTSNEHAETLYRWENDFQNYIINEGDDESAGNNIVQEIELDATAYGIALLNLYHAAHGIERDIHLTIPEQISDMVFQKAQDYIHNKPEIQSFIKWQQKLHQKEYVTKTIKQNRKIGRNELCPCGSGLKFKKCCIGKGIYD